MGFFDLAVPLLDAAYDVLPTLPSPLLVTIILGFTCGAGSMWLYAAISPQAELTVLKNRVRELRQAISDTDDEDELLNLTRQLLAASFAHLRKVILPVVLSSIPVLFVAVWIDRQFSLVEPQPGRIVAINWEPPSIAVHPESADLVEAPGGLELTWPGSGHVTVPTVAADTIQLTMERPPALLHKRQWWNILFGNPAGYLPDQAGIDQISVEWPQRHWLPWGPPWASGPLAVFFVIIFAISMIIKTAVKLQ